ncbi:MAG: NAD(P)-dependent alcohol dehydrogenase, partial [Verrucomicrobia bacterium]|nr:NAD(P)-dependent alcohol dehydrogenase [Verrucomicrobiota bacterium]
MSQIIQGYAAKTPKSKLEPFSFNLPDLKADKIRVQVKYCGICHSDIAMIDNDFGFSSYPLVPGHEVIGTIVEVGSDVKGLRVGQTVGVGWQSGSCGVCEYCEKGKEHLCASEEDTIVGRFGGWAQELQVDAKFGVPVPEGLNCPEAAPLLCAGNTVFGPILHHNVKSTMRVAVVGIGGLGHLAVQFLAKWGCDVTAISSSHGKDEQARKLGAKHFIATKGSDELQKAANHFDFIISTVSADVNWRDYLAALRPEGTLVIVGITERDLQLPPLELILKEKRVSGGRASSPSDIAEMFAFADRNNVKAVIEKFPFTEIDSAVDKVRSGHVVHRAVLE